MNSPKQVLVTGFLLMLALGATELGYSQRRPQRTKHVLWLDPGKISARDLTHGPGAPDLVPVPPFTFIEDKEGESPKFDVQDARGVRWTVKMGEANRRYSACLGRRLLRR